MNKNILFISEKQIKEKSIVNDNVDGKMLSTIISNVQSIQLKAILGTELYSTLINEVENVITVPNYTLTDQLSVLLNDYIIPFLSYAVLIDIIVFNNYKITNKGAMKFTDNSSSSIGVDELNNIKNYYDNYVSVYKKHLIEFLIKEGLSNSRTDKNVEAYSIGWYLDKTNPYLNPNFYEDNKYKFHYYTNG